MNPKPSIEFVGVCSICGFHYKTRASYNAHMRRNHEPNDPVSCTYCGKKFPGPGRLTEHHNAVHLEKMCPFCGIMVSGNARLHNHKKTVHTKDRPYNCETCGKGFLQRRFLEEHYNVHTGAKPFKCQYCPKAFGSQGTHAGHEKSHLGIKRKQKI